MHSCSQFEYGVALTRVLPAIRRLELSTTPEGISTGGDDGVLPVNPVEAIFPEVVRVSISDAIVNAVGRKPMMEISGLSVKDMEFSLDIFGTQRRACIQIRKFLMEDLMACRRSASERSEKILLTRILSHLRNLFGLNWLTAFVLKPTAN